MKNPSYGVYTDTKDLPEYARKTAASLERGDTHTTKAAAVRARRSLDAIGNAHRRGSEYAKAHVRIPQSLEWLLDNWYIAQREGKSAAADLKAFKALPHVRGMRKRPLVSESARLLLVSGQCEVTAERLEVFLDAFQDSIRLSEEELYAFIPAIKLELIDVLADGCRRLFADMESNTIIAETNTTVNKIENDNDLSELFGTIFTSLRFLSGFDSQPLLESVNRVERALRLDPSGIYAGMDDSTRFSYRRELTRLARLNDIDELEAAKYALELSEPDEHVGRYIFTKPLGSEKKKRTGDLYIGFILLASFFFALLIGFTLNAPAISFLLLLPVSDIVKNVTDHFALRLFRPQRVERLELKDGIPADGRTLAVVSVLLSSTAAGENAAARLEEYRISNRDAGSENFMLALLADLPESKTPETPGDSLFIESAAAEINRLNEKYGGGFYLLCRTRVRNERDGRWGGWERKRGAVLELCRRLRGRQTSLFCAAGDESALTGIKYLIALDSDTRLSAGTARELAGAAMHPLNRPVIDRERGVVIEGSGIIQPRVSVELSAAGKTDFTRFFAGQGGVDPYGGAASDLYQNMLGTGSFTGKGIIDIDAYLECLDTRFPDNSVLSHDLLEGAFLRCAFAGDIELTDGFPSNVKSYYSRMHRWTRGDWQSLPWLARRIVNAKGEKTKNPLTQMDKWKIVDNLRRSLVPPFLMAAMLAGVLSGNAVFLVTFAVAVVTLFFELLLSGTVSLFKRRGGRVRYISSVLGGFGGQLVQTFVRLMLLPFEAWVCFHAITLALFRMCFTRKKLLEWITAAEAEKRFKSGAVSYYLRMWPCLAASGCILLLTPYVPAAALAIVWALTPLYAFSLGAPKRVRRVISGEDRLLLSRCAGDAWRYFEELLTPEDNYLPPDNYQEQPSVGIAHRTSPTNIGLALISALAAIDLGACKKDTAFSLIAAMLDTIARLPKWRGHLYNWYDTTTLRVLNPAYVSTVDCGNFAGCLIALRSGLLEYGEISLATAADELLAQMSFAPLFDEKRMLFYIGWDCSKDAPSDSWYDLLASEAMLTSYLAVARGDVSRKHWRRLSRSLVSLNGYRGMVSWTGTMFEYLMPGLLLPCYRDSLIYESLKFCVYAQKKRPAGRPWGMSESAFYDFDHTLSYRYKAHGVQQLALKRGMARDAVISPYSSFLALAVDLKSSLYNLRRMQKLGAEGRYGFYEALDYTPSRMRSREYEVVRTYMAHHVGMSIISIDNVLNNSVMQKRFMRDCEMSAFSELLQEKVPIGGIVLRSPPRDVPEKPLRIKTPAWSFESEEIDASFPRCCLVGNGAYTVTMAETGQSRSVWNGVTLTRSSGEPAGLDGGISFFLYSGGELVSLLPSPLFTPGVNYGVQMAGGVCRITMKNGGITSVSAVTVPEGDAGELRTIEITSGVKRDAELICYFEPVLSRSSDYDSHPAFSRLSLETSELDGAIIVRRRPRVKGHGLALAFASDSPFEYDTSRETAFGRGGILSILKPLTGTLAKTTGAVLDPCVFARVKLSLEPDTPVRVSFALAPSYHPESAAAAAQRILSDGGQTAASRLDGAANRLGLTPEQTESAMLLLREIVYPSPYRHVPSELTDALARKQRGLWSLGVSGDFPILTAVIESENDSPAVEELIKAHTFLSECGASFDLVFLLTEGGDYRGALKNCVTDILRSNGLEWKLGARCGIHAADITSEGTDIVMAASFRVLKQGEKLTADYVRERIPAPQPPELYPPGIDQKLDYGYNDDNSFYFKSGGVLPLNAWSHMLSNGSFGYIASDAGTGHMWHQNARENKINRWLNDSLATEGTERLVLVSGGRKVSLFAAPDGFPYQVNYGFGYARWEKKIGDADVRFTAFVPHDTACRVFIIETENPGDAEILYYTDLVLGANNAESIYVTTVKQGNVIAAKNTYSADFCDTVFFHLASRPEKSFTCSKSDFLTGEYSGVTGTGFSPCIAAVYPAGETLVLVSGCAEPKALTALASPSAAKLKLKETIAWWQAVTQRLTVKTPSENLNRYLNGWAVYQTLACRVLGRSSVYQSGGAYGFRDQLQDVCALTGIAPEETRAQIIRAAEHQYEEGDVQHWWHPGTSGEGSPCDKGVRTKCSDDLLWLPYALCEYTEKTGDLTICNQLAGYLRSAPLHEDETERYEQPDKSDRIEPILTHALRAIDLVFARGPGRHGLCLIGGGDWNDGMNLVGAGGEGESVWLTWFLVHTARRLSGLCERLGNHEAAARYLEEAEGYQKAAEEAWDGKWFLRGYFDDGTPLGSTNSDECRIDSIAQSFSVLADADSEKIKTALANTVEVLFNRNDRVIMLFDPPFGAGRTSPGYIKGYSPGFRENGGQYTHGAVWLSMALLISGMTELGAETLEALLPQSRAYEKYRTEPYVLAADVYTNESHLGRGGWTWYTGASGWFYRVAVENLLGLRLSGGVLQVEQPKLPESWAGFEAVWKSGGEEYTIKVKNGGAAQILRGGEPVQDGGVVVLNKETAGFTEI